VAANTSVSAGLASRYATALYELADESRQLDAVAADLQQLKAMVGASAELRQLMMSPLLPRDAQAKAMADVVAHAGLSDLTRRFVGMLARNRRLYALVGIAAAFTAMLAAHRGEVTAEVVSATPLSAPQLEAVAAALRTAVGSKISIDQKVDPKLIGGLKVKVGSRLVDASLASKLQRMQLAMKGIG
jgi:F-type H+-transporting ATPase subunit delta